MKDSSRVSTKSITPITQLNSAATCKRLGKRPGHVRRHHQHHQVRRPAVDVADELAEGNLCLDCLDVAVGVARRRDIEEHQVHPGGDQRTQQNYRRDTEIPRVAEMQFAAPHLHRIKVQ